MTKYINTAGGTYILSSEITEIKNREDDKCVIKTRRKKSYEVLSNGTELASELEINSGQVIPALPGYSVIFAVKPKDKQRKWKKHSLPVVGWVVEPRNSECPFVSVPVLPALFDTSGMWALVSPGGKVVSRHGGEFKSIDRWLVDVEISAALAGTDFEDDNENDNESKENEGAD